MVPEIWSVTDIFFIILDHFLPSYHPNNLKNQNVEKKRKEKKPGDNTCYIVPETWHGTDVIVIFHFGLYFLSFYPPNSLKNQN